MYATVALFVEAFGEPEAIMLSNLDTPTANTINIVALERAMVDSSALIDSYISRRHLLPLTTIPRVLITYVLDITRYRLDRIRSREDVKERYKDALKFLENVSVGKCLLGTDVITDKPHPATTTCGLTEFTVSPSINLGGF